MNPIYAHLLGRLGSGDLDTWSPATVELAFHLEEHFMGLVDTGARECVPNPRLYGFKPQPKELEELVARVRQLIEDGPADPRATESLKWALEKAGVKSDAEDDD